MGFHHNQHAIRKCDGAFLPNQLIADAQAGADLNILVKKRIFKSGQCDAVHMLGQRKKGNVSAPQSAAPEGALPVNQVYPVLAVQYTGLYPLLEAGCLLYTSPSPRDISGSRMPSSA